MRTSSLLRQNRLLHHLTGSDIFDILSVLKECPLPLDAVLHVSGEPIEFVYFPLSGIISLLTLSRSGEQVKTGITGRDGVLGASVGAFGPNSFGQAIVRVPGTALRASCSDVLAIYNKSHSFRSLLNDFQSVLFAQAQQAAVCYALHSVKSRLCRWILHVHDITRNDHIRVTQEALSLILVAQRSYVNKFISVLHTERSLQSTRASIRVLDRDALKKNACGCYSIIHRLTLPGSL